METGYHRALERDKEDSKKYEVLSQRPREKVPEEQCLIVKDQEMSI